MDSVVAGATVNGVAGGAAANGVVAVASGDPVAPAAGDDDVVADGSGAVGAIDAAGMVGQFQLTVTSRRCQPAALAAGETVGRASVPPSSAAVNEASGASGTSFTVSCDDRGRCPCPDGGVIHQ
jgi:hypothetical protein